MNTYSLKEPKQPNANPTKATKPKEEETSDNEKDKEAGDDSEDDEYIEF